MYLTNKYTKYYYSIISNAQIRTGLELFETHHIIPKSLGGNNKKTNLVKLTPREHFICHLLLTKMLTGVDKAKMVNAALRLSNDGKGRGVNSRIYEMIKQDRIAFLKESMIGPGNHFYGRKHSEETKKKMSESRKKWKFTEEYKEKMRGRKGPMQGKTHSQETKKRLSEVGKLKVFTDEWRSNISKGLTGITRSNATKNKMRQSKLGIKHPTAICPHCGKEITVGMFARWHGEKCKLRDKSESHQSKEQP
jgi:hypothetical protein